jgi:hypothetical protein
VTSKTLEFIDSEGEEFAMKVGDAQNFLKHGYHKQKFPDVLSFPPEMTELLILDACAVFERLFGSLSPLMKAFLLHFSITHPHVLPPPQSKEKLFKGIKIEDFAGLTRAKFLEKLFPGTTMAD